MTEEYTKESKCTCGKPENCKCGIDKTAEMSTDNGGGCGCGGTCGA